MHIDFKHGLPDADARARLEALGEYLSNKHGIQVTWADGKARFNGRYMVVKIEGEMSLGTGVIHVRGQDPGILWRKRAVSYLEGKLETYLDGRTPIAELSRGK